MKRKLRILTLCILLSLSLPALFSCGHEHKYTEDWSQNATHHWHAAECRHEEEKADFAQHDLDDGREENGEKVYACKTCAYEITSTDLSLNPISVSLAHSFAPNGEVILVRGYFAGVANGGDTSSKEILLKDTESDALIAVTGLPETYGTWPDFGYEKGDLVELYAIVSDNTYDLYTTGSQNKRSLQFSRRNREIESTILSRGNAVSYRFSDAVLIESHEDMKALFKMDSLSAYTYVRIKGNVFLNTYKSSSNATLLYRPYMNGAATALSGIKPDGVRAIGLYENMLTANLGTAWEDYFTTDWTNASVAVSSGRVQEVDIFAVFTNASDTNYHLTVLDPSWLRPVSESLAIESAQDALMETAKAYLRKGGVLEYDQYNNRRMVYATPEQASTQSYVFLDCSSYVTSVYYNTFGISAIPSAFGSQNTKNYAAYAKANHENPEYPDVIGYWETLDYTSKTEQLAVLAEVENLLQPGDILVYRRGSKNYGANYSESNLTGHAMLYMGNGMFSHSTGTSWNNGGSEAKYLYKDDPTKAADRATTEEYYNGTVQWLSAETVLSIGKGGRMLFGDKNTFIYNFAILRPLARKGETLTLTEQAEKRMAMAGLSFEKITDAGLNNAVLRGQQITYTLTVKNFEGNAYSGIVFTDILPEGISFVSANIPITQNGNTLTASIDIGKKETKEIVWTVKVGDSLPAGTELCHQTTVGGLKMKTISNTVSDYTAEEHAKIASIAKQIAESGETFADPLAFVSVVYTEALGIDPFEGKTAAEMLSLLFTYTAENKAVLNEESAYADMVAKNLCGGSDLYSTSYGSNHARVRTVYQEMLREGDVILCEWYGNIRVLIYLGDGEIAAIDSETLTCTVEKNGTQRWDKIGDYYLQDHYLASLYSYQQFAVLRPASIEK